MFESLNQTTGTEATILRNLRVWIVALAVVCMLTGMGIGAILAGRPAVAQDETQSVARAPEALSASFVEIARGPAPGCDNNHTAPEGENPPSVRDVQMDQTPSGALLGMCRG